MQSPKRYFVCPTCGKHTFVPSRVTLEANEGSIHDGEQATINLCGECVDWFFDAVKANIREIMDGIW